MHSLIPAAIYCAPFIALFLLLALCFRVVVRTNEVHRNTDAGKAVMDKIGGANE